MSDKILSNFDYDAFFKLHMKRNYILEDSDDCSKTLDQLHINAMKNYYQKRQKLDNTQLRVTSLAKELNALQAFNKDLSNHHKRLNDCTNRLTKQIRHHEIKRDEALASYTKLSNNVADMYSKLQNEFNVDYLQQNIQQIENEQEILRLKYNNEVKHLAEIRTSLKELSVPNPTMEMVNKIKKELAAKCDMFAEDSKIASVKGIVDDLEN